MDTCGIGSNSHDTNVQISGVTKMTKIKQHITDIENLMKFAWDILDYITAVEKYSALFYSTNGVVKKIYSMLQGYPYIVYDFVAVPELLEKSLKEREYDVIVATTGDIPSHVKPLFKDKFVLLLDRNISEFSQKIKEIAQKCYILSSKDESFYLDIFRYTTKLAKLKKTYEECLKELENTKCLYHTNVTNLDEVINANKFAQTV